MAADLTTASIPRFEGSPVLGSTTAIRAPSGTGKGSVVVPHASEVNYVFSEEVTLVPGEEAELAALMASYWASFARTGDPNAHAASAVVWPAYDPAADESLRFDVASAGGIRVERGLRHDACAFMDARAEAGRGSTYRWDEP